VNKESKDLETKIIDYLKRLEKNEISPPLSSKKKSLLLTSKSEYEKLEQEQKEYQELNQEVSKEEKNLLLVEIKNLVLPDSELTTVIF
jgi:hypothetical protein